MTPAHILLVEDEYKIAEVLQEYLQGHGYRVSHLNHGKNLLDWLSKHPVDVILLDVMLPGTDGLELCQKIRQTSQVPIALITAKVEEVDRILGWEMGADDYICKPFSLREVLSRVKALVRRAQPQSGPLHNNQAWLLDVNKFKVFYQNKSVDLSAIECAILRLLSQSPGRIFSRNQLMNAIYTDNRVVSDRTIDSHIKKLRHKMSAVFGEVELIYSVYGAGYKFEPPEN
ncbi:response regulator [Thiomicrospira sp. R3]|uniref:response regulator n=1 Tax=Thiomicrospira sp. R3 TaxID=3035472 RepID=UPI00259BEDFF|nr:response regulator [Thiomicrospira sp. R3]WFE69227.1 response regulator [Thiomicrospira sp. R3]